MKSEPKWPEISSNYDFNQALRFCKEAFTEWLKEQKPVVSREELSDLIYSKLLDLCRHTVIDGQDACVVINPIVQAPKLADAVIHHLLEGKKG